MLIPDHPHDERLSALAAGDPEATADAALGEHLATCARCTDTVGELSALRASLAELPDLRPHRPLRLLPQVADAPSRADRIGGWARRFFAPALAAGAAVAMVGLVGTASPMFQGLAEGLGGVTPQQLEDGAPAAGEDSGQERGVTTDMDTFADASSAPAGAESDTDGGSELVPVTSPEDDDSRLGFEDQGTETVSIPAERSPWPMVLFSGVAIMIAAALLRWILAPRAG